ncbi:hypothetical protein L3X38_006998 [Prunus dulcis]|uniref:Receptor ligand binding region domain-containing protein n=1 Tax=Prunus dulcis TaxID=3755 RepID=A0AAD4ZTQ6_PRUDU|nr:hypothetical protein L3X38_006998 [Prunus dulcis]
MTENKTIIPTIIPVNVGVVLDDLHSTRLVLHSRDAKKKVVHAADAALDLIKNEQVQAIIEPVTSMETTFVINLGDQAYVPIISFSATSPSLHFEAPTLSNLHKMTHPKWKP